MRWAAVVLLALLGSPADAKVEWSEETERIACDPEVECAVGKKREIKFCVERDANGRTVSVKKCRPALLFHWRVKQLTQEDLDGAVEACRDGRVPS